MKALITGITGFAGSHLAEYILAEHRDYEVYGTMRWRSRTENIREIESKTQLIECDLRDSSSVKKLIESVEPDRIFHLAQHGYLKQTENKATSSSFIITDKGRAAAK